MAVDINGFDIVFSAANANHAAAIDKAIENMSAKIPALSNGLQGMADALERLGKMKTDQIATNLESIKKSIDNIDADKLSKAFSLANGSSNELLATVTAVVNKLSSINLSALTGQGNKIEVEDKTTHVKTTKPDSGEQQSQEQLNALLKQREEEMRTLIGLQDQLTSKTGETLAQEQKITEELQKRFNLATQGNIQTQTPSNTQTTAEVSVKINEQTLVADIKALGERLATIFKDIPVSLKKELDISFFENKAAEIRRMFESITVGSQQVAMPKSDALQVAEFNESSALRAKAEAEAYFIEQLKNSIPLLEQQIAKQKEAVEQARTRHNQDPDLFTLQALNDTNAALKTKQDLLIAAQTLEKSSVITYEQEALFLSEMASKWQAVLNARQAYNTACDETKRIAQEETQAQKKSAEDLANKFKDIPVSLKKELDLTFFVNKAKELKAMFDGVVIPTPKAQDVQTTEGVVHKPQSNTGTSALSADTTQVLEAAFERMDILTNQLVEKIKSIGTAENTVFTELRNDIQGVTTALQGLVEQLSQVEEKKPRKKAGKKEEQIVSEEDVILTKEQRAELDNINKELAKQITLLNELKNKQASQTKQTGMGDLFVQGDIDKAESAIETLKKKKEDLLVGARGVAFDKEIEASKQVNQTELDIIENVQKEGVERQKNIAYLTQMIRLIDNMLKYGNFGQGMDMFSGMQQYFVDVQGKMKELLKEQKTTTDQRVAAEQKANQDMAMSYLRMVGDELAAQERLKNATIKSNQEAAQAQYQSYKEREAMYNKLFGATGEQGTNAFQLDAFASKSDAMARQIADVRQKYVAEINAIEDKIRELNTMTGLFEKSNQAEYEKTQSDIAFTKELIASYTAELAKLKSELVSPKSDKATYKDQLSSIEALKNDIKELELDLIKLQGKLTAITGNDNVAKSNAISSLLGQKGDVALEMDRIVKSIQDAKDENDEFVKHFTKISELKNLIRGVEEEYDKLKMSGKAVSADGKNTAEASALIQRKQSLDQQLGYLQRTITEAEKLKKTDELTTAQIKAMTNEYARLFTQIDRVSASKDKLTAANTELQAKGITNAAVSQGITGATDELAKLNARKEEIEEKLQGQLDGIVATHNRKRGEQAVKDFEKAEREKSKTAEREAKKRADAEKKKVANYKQQNLDTNTSLAGAVKFAETANTINRLQTALKYLQDALYKTKPNTPEWNTANKAYQETKKRIDDIKKSMEGVKTQTQSMMPSLKNLAMQMGLVFSVQQLQQWVKHMVQVRAQFELQNIALRSLLQSKEKGDEVFAQVQQLAMKSPFSIMQLNTYTKQMAAYGVEADKVVGVTKQLADVSAGLGVEMGRLILAYGQVKTANYLRATEVRQFTEAGLNITQELANYFSEMTGQMVRAADVTEMITKRMVSFEDVAEVFNRVTSAGGMFYNMQEKQAEGLAGQIQRIGDAYSIMLNDIGRSNTGTIATVLASVRAIIQEWRKYAIILKVVVGIFATYKTMTLLAALGNSRFAQTIIAAIPALRALRNEEVQTITITMALQNALKGIGASLVLGAVLIPLTIVIDTLITKFAEWRALNQQIEEGLDRIRDEVNGDLANSIAQYERLARVLSDNTRSYEDQQEALGEINRAFKDILPQEMLETEYIQSHVGAWEDVKQAMQDYYNEQKLQKAQQTIDEALSPKTEKVKNDITKTTLKFIADENLGLDKSTLKNFLSNVLKELNDGAISTTQEAVGEYITQIETYTNTTLTESTKSVLIKNLTVYTDDFDKLIELSEKYKDAMLDAVGATEVFETAQEKANAEREKFMKGRADEITALIEDTSEMLNTLNTLQVQINQTKLTADSPERTAKLEELQKNYNKALADTKERYKALGLALPDFTKVTADTVSLRRETEKLALSIVRRFESGVSPQVIELRANYKRLMQLQQEFNSEVSKGGQADSERISAISSQITILTKNIKKQYRDMHVDVVGNIQETAKSLDTIQTEMERVTNATKEYFQTRIVGAVKKWLETHLPNSVNKLLKKFGRALNIESGSEEENTNTNKEKIATEAQIKANENLVKKIKEKNKAIETGKELTLQAGQAIDGYVKQLKSYVETNEEMLDDYYNKTDNKKQWLSLYKKTEAEMANLKKLTKAARQIAIAYDPDIFDKKTRSKDNTVELAKKRFEFIVRANSEYEKLLKNYDKEVAKQKLLNDMLAEAKELKIDSQFKSAADNAGNFDKPTAMLSLQQVYNDIYTKLVKKYPEIAQDFQKKYGGLALDIDVKLREQSRERIKREMDELMGSYELSIELEKSGVDPQAISALFGIDTNDLYQVSTKLEDFWIQQANSAEQASAIAEKRQARLFTTVAEAVKSLGEDAEKEYASQQERITEKLRTELRNRMKEYTKYLKQSYSDAVNAQLEAYDKIVKVQADTRMQEKLIRKNDNLSTAQQDKEIEDLKGKVDVITSKIQEELDSKLAQIEFSNFKENPIFTEMFTELDRVGKLTIDALIKNIENLKGSLGDLNPKAVKELVQLQEKLYEQKAENAPFKETIAALKEVFALKKQGLSFDKLNAQLVDQSQELTALQKEEDEISVLIDLHRQLDNAKLKEQNLTPDQQALATNTTEQLEAMLQQANLTERQRADIEYILELKKQQADIDARITSMSETENKITQKGARTLAAAIRENRKQQKVKKDQIGVTQGQINSYKKAKISLDALAEGMAEFGEMCKKSFQAAKDGVEAFGGEHSEITAMYLDAFDTISQGAIQLGITLVTVGEEANTAMGVIGLIAEAVSLLMTAVTLISQIHDAKLQKEIEAEEKKIEKLQRAFENLKEAIDNAFSSHDLGNSTQQALDNIEAQIAAREKQIALEKDKKKKDKDQISEWENEIEDDYKKIKETQAEYNNTLGGLGTGSDVLDAATNFVDAWVEAFNETGDGLSGLQKNFNEFMQNIVKKQAYMRIADHWIDKFGEMINNSFDDKGQVAWDRLQLAMKWFQETAMPEMNAALENFAEYWDKIGITMSDSESNLSGLAAGIQGVTEETAQIVEALLNSMRYFVADTNDAVRSIAQTFINPPQDNVFLVELRAQTAQLVALNNTLKSVIKTGHHTGGSGIKVFS